MMSRHLAVAVALSVAWGCGGDTVSVVDLERQLMDADREFFQETVARGADGWADFFQNDGVQFPNSGIVSGREAIREYMAAAFDPGSPRLTWEPTFARASSSGDLGYTWGRWSLLAADSDSALAAGHYVTIWERDEVGDWKVALDIGNTDADQ